MAEQARVKGLASEERIILAADISYLIAFILISTRLSVAVLEVALLFLVLVSLGTLVFTMTRGASGTTRTLFNVAHIVIGGAIAVRYLIYFATDLTYLSALLLFVGILGLGYGAVVKLVALVRARGVAPTGAPTRPTREPEPSEQGS